MKLLVPTAAAIVALAVCVPATTAAPLRSAQGSSLCSTAHAVAKYLTTTLKLTASGAAAETPANLKRAYTAVGNSEGAMLAGAPASLRPSLEVAFSWLNLVRADFAKAGWQIKNMTPYFPALVAKANADAKQLAAVRAYLRGTCHLPV
jgi:hypothetical protein